jgi:DNA-binding GntR family transcriptional regulator
MLSDGNTSSRIAEQLRQEITSGERAPGTPLRQEVLAKELGVSRMPVRDALQKLLAEGLVILQPHRGTYISSLTPAECAELFDLRMMLECDALRRAMNNHTAASRRKLRFVQAELELAKDTRGWVDGDREFHELLYAPCARPRTLEIIRTLRDSVQRFYMGAMNHSDHRKGWKHEHRLILKATDRNDADAACAALETHLRETERVVQSRLKQLDYKGAP